MLAQAQLATSCFFVPPSTLVIIEHLDPSPCRVMPESTKGGSISGIASLSGGGSSTPRPLDADLATRLVDEELPENFAKWLAENGIYSIARFALRLQGDISKLLEIFGFGFHSNPVQPWEGGTQIYTGAQPGPWKEGVWRRGHHEESHLQTILSCGASSLFTTSSKT